MASDVKSQNFGSQFTGSPLGPIPHTKGKINENKSPGKTQNSSHSYSATQIGTSPLHSTNPQASMCFDFLYLSQIFFYLHMV